MKKSVALALVLLLLCVSAALAAPVKKKVAAKKPVPVPAVKKVFVPAAKVAPVPAVSAKDRGFAAKAGLLGGAAAAEIGYYFPVGPLTTGIYVGYGLGNKFNVATAQLEEAIRLGPVNVALVFDYANYSSAVNNLPGISGITTRGSHTGLGLAVSKDINEKLSAAVGYSSALGLTAAANYKF